MVIKPLHYLAADTTDRTVEYLIRDMRYPSHWSSITVNADRTYGQVITHQNPNIVAIVGMSTVDTILAFATDAPDYTVEIVP